MWIAFDPQQIKSIWNRGAWSSSDPRVLYSTGSDTASTITIDDIREVFPGQNAGLNEDGSIWVRTRNGHGVVIQNVDKIDDSRVAFEACYGRMRMDGELLSGKYQDGVIEISQAGGKWTLRHEQVHWLEDSGLIGPFEIALLRSHIRKLQTEGKFETANEQDIGGPEDRANFIANELHGAREHPGFITRILAKIRDFIDRLVNLAVRGIVRDVGSGRIMERRVHGLNGLLSDPNGQ